MSNQFDPTVSAMLRGVRDFLVHEHSIFKIFDLKATSLARGAVSFSARLPEGFDDAHGCVHGGLITLALDSIYGLCVFTALEKLQPIATITLHTDYFAAAKAGAHVSISAERRRIRGDIAYIDGAIKNEASGETIAVANGAFMIGTRSRPQDE